MTKQFFSEKDVLRLLRSEILRSGGQTEWARGAGVNRVNLNRILNGHRALSRNFVKALKLKECRVDVLEQLERAIERAGSISQLSRQIGIDRTLISRSLHRRRRPPKTLFHALKISRMTFYAPIGDELS
jgi:DNA-binding phage protein